MDERARQAIKDVTADAQEAWDDGRAFYAPRLTVFGSAESETVSKPSELAYILITRNPFWEEALESIIAIGWQLHTWETHNVTATISYSSAQPLFTRP